RAAVKVGDHTWEAEGSQVWSMSNGKADSLVLEVFGDETSGQQDCDIASFIAEASPANVLMLLDELSESQACKANESDCADSAINLAINWQMRCKDAEAKLEAAEKRIAEHRKVLNSLAAVARRYLPDYDEHPEIQAADELLESAAGIGVKGE
ncbi:ead/Ea22-like family protein, partial [Citrobacter werkmanii]